MPLESAPPALAAALNIFTISTLVSAAAAEITQLVPATFVKPVYTLGDRVLQAKDWRPCVTSGKMGGEWAHWNLH